MWTPADGATDLYNGGASKEKKIRDAVDKIKDTILGALFSK